MSRVEISQARADLSALANRAGEGEEIILTRYGKEVCLLGPLQKHTHPIPSMDIGASPADFARPLPEPEIDPPKPQKTNQQAIDAILRGVNRQKPRK